MALRDVFIESSNRSLLIGKDVRVYDRPFRVVRFREDSQNEGEFFVMGYFLDEKDPAGKSVYIMRSFPEDLAQES